MYNGVWLFRPFAVSLPGTLHVCMMLDAWQSALIVSWHIKLVGL